MGPLRTQSYIHICACAYFSAMHHSRHGSQVQMLCAICAKFWQDVHTMWLVWASTRVISHGAVLQTNTCVLQAWKEEGWKPWRGPSIIHIHKEGWHAGPAAESTRTRVLESPPFRLPAPTYSRYSPGRYMAKTRPHYFCRAEQQQVCYQIFMSGATNLRGVCHLAGGLM